MSSITRRKFLQTGAVGLFAIGPVSGLFANGQEAANTSFRNLVPKDRPVRVAVIGVGGRAEENIRGITAAGAELVALCDVDFNRARNTFMAYPELPRYKDYRKMLKEMDGEIDAVMISTPDHMHFPPALMAIEMGKHVYVEKPLTHTIGEARILKDAAQKAGVVTIMGNQGHANEGTRLHKEWIDAGVIGDVREVHAWTDRPFWPQGVHLPNSEQAPDSIDWNLWQGVAPERDYSSKIAPFNWRGLWDYGCGSLGDMGCHILDATFWALNLTGPVKVSAEFDRKAEDAVSAPSSVIVTYEFPARGELPPVKVVWYEGKAKPPRPKEFSESARFPGNGVLLYGDKGILLNDSAYGSSPKLLPAQKMAEFRSRPPRTIPRVAGANPYAEFINACQGGTAPGSRIDGYAADLTEMILLGNLAMRTDKPIEWDPATGECKDMPEMNRFINKHYREF